MSMVSSHGIGGKLVAPDWTFYALDARADFCAGRRALEPCKPGLGLMDPVIDPQTGKWEDA